MGLKNGGMLCWKMGGSAIDSVAAVAGGGPFYRPGCTYHVIVAAASVETKRGV